MEPNCRAHLILLLDDWYFKCVRHFSILLAEKFFPRGHRSYHLNDYRFLSALAAQLKSKNCRSEITLGLSDWWLERKICNMIGV